jgi:hypothetical protein
MIKCEKCGRRYFSTKQFENIVFGNRNMFVCPYCQKEKENINNEIDERWNEISENKSY